MNDAAHSERVRAVRFGFSNLLVWAVLGLGLEAAHGLKWAPYLDDELARTLLRLAHAHGVVLSIVCLVYAGVGVDALSTRADAGRPVRQLLTAASLLMPLGFFGSAWGHGEADPGLAIWLVPLGALCLLLALGWLAVASFGHR